MFSRRRCWSSDPLEHNAETIQRETNLKARMIDVSTDGKWCYVVLWVIPHSSSIMVRWASLKNQLLSVCPSCSVSFYFEPTTRSTASPVYLLKFLCLDRKALLHDVTQVPCELELTIQRVKVSTTPDGRVLDPFLF